MLTHPLASLLKTYFVASSAQLLAHVLAVEANFSEMDSSAVLRHNVYRLLQICVGYKIRLD